MKFCVECGKEFEEGKKFCPNCGAAIAGAKTETKAGGNDAEENKLMAILAYLFFFVPLLTGDYKKSPFVKYHLNQGIILIILSVALGVVYGILSAILGAILIYSSSGLGAYAIIMTILSLVWFVPGILCIIGIINAATGKTKELPIIGKFQILK